MEIIWSSRSLTKLEQIGDYIALDSPANAIAFVEKIVKAVERLKRFPLSGSIVPESPNLRQLIFDGYRIIYRPSDKKIEIVTILGPAQE